jgi:hypothetical protein
VGLVPAEGGFVVEAGYLVSVQHEGERARCGRAHPTVSAGRRGFHEMGGA